MLNNYTLYEWYVDPKERKTTSVNKFHQNNHHFTHVMWVFSATLGRLEVCHSFLFISFMAWRMLLRTPTAVMSMFSRSFSVSRRKTSNVTWSRKLVVIFIYNDKEGVFITVATELAISACLQWLGTCNKSHFLALSPFYSHPLCTYSVTYSF